MSPLTLPPRLLLKQSAAFALVYRDGRRRRGPGFVLVYRANTLGWCRLGISIHRTLRGSVRRNRIKRVIREAYRLYREVFPPGCDVVMAVRPEYQLDCPQAVRQAVVTALAQRAGSGLRSQAPSVLGHP